MTRTTEGARIASGGACDKLFHIGTDVHAELLELADHGPGLLGNSCGAFSFPGFLSSFAAFRATIPESPLRVVARSHLYLPDGENRHRDITPRGRTAQAAEGNGEGRIRTRVRTHETRGSRLPTFALPDKEFLASTATSKAACRRASDQGFCADWPYRAGCLASYAGKDRRPRSGYS